ncbi:hypothetical protein ACFL54_03065 [Planctomycetota bacterium]
MPSCSHMRGSDILPYLTKSAIWLALLLLAVASRFFCICYADDLVLTSGIPLHVAVLEESPGKLTVSTLWDTIHEIPLTRIEKRSTGEFILDQLDKRRQTLDMADAEAVYQLGLWCRAKDLESQAYPLFVEALEADPGHAGSRLALGYRRDIDSNWQAGSKFLKMLMQYRDTCDRLEQDMILLNDKWVPASHLDAMLEGAKEVDGYWLTPAQIQTITGLRSISEIVEPSEYEKKLEVELKTFQTGLFHIYSYQSPQKIRHLIERLNQAYFKFLEMMELPPYVQLWSQHVEIFIFAGKEDSFNYYRHYLMADNPEAMTKLMQKNPRTFWYNPPGILMYKTPTATAESIESQILHIVTHNMMYRYPSRGEVPHWLNEGIAGFLEYSFFGKAAGYCYGPRTRVSGEPQQEGIRYFRGENWLKWVKKLVKKKKNRPVAELISSDLANITMEDLAQLYTVIGYVTDFSPRTLNRLIKTSKQLPLDRQQDSFQTVFGQTPEEFDRGWQRWVRKQKTK